MGLRLTNIDPTLMGPTPIYEPTCSTAGSDAIEHVRCSIGVGPMRRGVDVGQPQAHGNPKEDGSRIIGRLRRKLSHAEDARVTVFRPAWGPSALEIGFSLSIQALSGFEPRRGGRGR